MFLAELEINSKHGLEPGRPTHLCNQSIIGGRIKLFARLSLLRSGGSSGPGFLLTHVCFVQHFEIPH